MTRVGVVVRLTLAPPQRLAQPRERLELLRTERFQLFVDIGRKRADDALREVLRQLCGDLFSLVIHGSSPRRRRRGYYAWKRGLSRPRPRLLCWPDGGFEAGQGSPPLRAAG